MQAIDRRQALGALAGALVTTLLPGSVKAQAGKLNFGSGGIGTPSHMSFESLRLRVPGLNAVYVPYKGAIEAVNAVAAKNLDFVSGLIIDRHGKPGGHWNDAWKTIRARCWSACRTSSGGARTRICANGSVRAASTASAS